MAHNNGSIPRSRKGKADSGLTDNARKFRGAVEHVPIPPAGTAYDPAPPSELDLPMHGGTGAELAGFVPHRPARPAKSEGGKKFIDWAMSKSTQEKLAMDIGRRSVRTDVAGPAGTPNLADLTLVDVKPLSDFGGADAVLAKWREAIGE